MDFRNSFPGSSLSFGVQQSQSLRQALVRYCETSEVRYAALLEESGMVCAEGGDSALRDHGETGALAAGAFAAVRAVAGRLGDESFEGIYHTGRKRQFYLSPVGSRFLLLSVFETQVRFAVVKLCAGKLTAQLDEILTDSTELPMDSPDPLEDGDFVLGSVLFAEE